MKLTQLDIPLLNATKIHIVGGLCLEGHRCYCLTDTDLFIDLTAHTQRTLKFGCNGIGGGNSGQ